MGFGAQRQKARDLEDDLHEQQVVLEVASADLRISLLERWPVLDDAYHPSYQATLTADANAIRAVLDQTPLAAAHDRAVSMARRGGHALDVLEVEIGMVRRLLRAYENVAAAAKLRDHDAVAYGRFMKFLSCERSLPPSRPDQRHAEPR